MKFKHVCSIINVLLYKSVKLLYYPKDNSHYCNIFYHRRISCNNQRGEIIMLAAKNLLDSLVEENNSSPQKNYNDDHDFSKVLEFCGGQATHESKIRYANGQEKSFSFKSEEMNEK